LNRIVRLAGWNQIEADWRRFMAMEPEGCFVAEAGQTPVGTITTITYGSKIGWIGMLIVAPSHRGLGVGKILLKHGIDYLQPKVDVIKLDATPQGRLVYEKLGFRPEYTIVRMVGEGHGQGSEQGRFYPVQNYLSEVAAFDERAFGANRAVVIRHLCQEYPDYSFCRMKNGRVAGYIMANRGRQAWHIAPWVARDKECAAELFFEMLGRLAGKRIYIDVPERNSNADSLMRSNGFTEQRRLTRMYLGENKWPGEPDFIYAIARPEKG